MADLFDADWMATYMTEWNNESDVADALAKIDFNSVIGYGFDGDDTPIGIITIENGIAVSAGAYDGEELSWDLRASRASWEKWIKKGIGMMGLGMAYTSRKLKFQVGDYSAMLKDPRMAKPFIKTFTVMGRV